MDPARLAASHYPRLAAACALAALLAQAAPAQAATSYRLGAGVQLGYNSAFVQPVQTLTGDPVATVSGMTLSLTPFVQSTTETGRISLSLRYQFVAEAVLVIDDASPAFSYQNALDAQARLDLTSRLAWNLGLVGAQGRINSFSQSASPNLATGTTPGTGQTSPLPTPSADPQATRLVATEFVSAAASSLFLWDPTARIRLSQPASFRAYIPYGEIAGQAATGSTQSYSLDGGIGMDHQFARANLGGEIRFGWFLPQRASGDMQNSAQSLVTGQGQLRGTAELAPRWRGTAQVGVYVATQADHFLQGRRIEGEGPAIREVQATLVTPIGGASLSYLFPRVDAQLSLSYNHGAAGEVFVGRLSLSDAVTLHAVLPLPKNLGLSASAGYRHADLFSGNSLGRNQYQVNARTGVDEATGLGQSYELYSVDAGLTWNVREGVQLYGRYAFHYQKVTGTLPDDAQLGLQDFNRHLASIGLALYWPTSTR